MDSVLIKNSVLINYSPQIEDQKSDQKKQESYEELEQKQIINQCQEQINLC